MLEFPHLIFLYIKFINFSETIIDDNFIFCPFFELFKHFIDNKFKKLIEEIQENLIFLFINEQFIAHKDYNLIITKAVFESYKIK